VEFVLLGRLDARSDGRRVQLGHARQRAVLAVLLVEADRGVPTDQLIERAWGDHHPRRPYDTLYSYLSRLRRVLADAGGVDLTRDSTGYRLCVDEETVDVLLPGTPTCAVLVTSRNSLTGLVGGLGAHPLPVDVLSEGESRSMLARRLGEERLAAEPDAVAEVLASCAGLPLALGVAAARAAVQPELDLAVIATELRDANGRLGVLDEDDGMPGLRAVLFGSYRALKPRQARVYALLGCAVGPDISLPAAAALTGLPADELAAALRGLEQRSLLQQHSPGRWRMHDLVRLYAGELCRRRPAQARRSAQRRLVDFLLHTSHAAARLLAPSRPPIALGGAVAGVRPHLLADVAAAEAWLDGEYSCLVAAQQLAMECGWRDTVWQLAWALWTFQHRRGYLHDQVAVWRKALSAVGETADPTSQIQVHRALGRAYGEVARHAEAVDHLHQALALAERSADIFHQAEAALALGRVYGQSGDDERALRHSTAALKLYRELGEPVREAVSRNGVGWHLIRLGRYDEAAVHLRAALDLHRRHRDTTYRADTLDSLGNLALRTRRYAEAVRYFDQAMALLREHGDLYGQADTLAQLGEAYCALGRRTDAERAWQQAGELYRVQRRAGEADRVEQRLHAIRGHG
jgi:tetratricopeptide (TPR) repeat protein